MSHVLSLRTIVGLKSEPYCAFYRLIWDRPCLYRASKRKHFCKKSLIIFLINYASKMRVIILVEIGWVGVRQSCIHIFLILAISALSLKYPQISPKINGLASREQKLKIAVLRKTFFVITFNSVKARHSIYQHRVVLVKTRWMNYNLRPGKIILKIWPKVKVMTWSEKVMLHISRSVSSASGLGT